VIRTSNCQTRTRKFASSSRQPGTRYFRNVLFFLSASCCDSSFVNTWLLCLPDARGKPPHARHPHQQQRRVRRGDRDRTAQGLLQHADHNPRLLIALPFNHASTQPLLHHAADEGQCGSANSRRRKRIFPRCLPRVKRNCEASAHAAMREFKWFAAFMRLRTLQTEAKCVGCGPCADLSNVLILFQLLHCQLIFWNASSQARCLQWDDRINSFVGRFVWPQPGLNVTRSFFVFFCRILKNATNCNQTNSSRRHLVTTSWNRAWGRVCSPRSWKACWLRDESSS